MFIRMVWCGVVTYISLRLVRYNKGHIYLTGSPSLVCSLCQVVPGSQLLEFSHIEEGWHPGYYKGESAGDFSRYPFASNLRHCRLEMTAAGRFLHCKQISVVSSGVSRHCQDPGCQR